jgi:hypothetical protein
MMAIDPGKIPQKALSGGLWLNECAVLACALPVVEFRGTV